MSKQPKYKIIFSASSHPFAVRRSRGVVDGKQVWDFVYAYATFDEAETAIARLSEAETILPRYYDANSSRLSDYEEAA